uniref:nucleoside hydrolase-like domain-containing protein n=1 Tax=Paenibacillus xylanexedens TaxID=528191 RepID=UPI0028E2C50E
MNKRKWLNGFAASCLSIILVISGCASKAPQTASDTPNQATEQTENETQEPANNQVAKGRTVITTDGEVDDMNSVIRFLLYSNEMDLAGIVLTSSVYHYAGDEEAGIKPFRWTGTQWVYDMIDAYGEIYPNLSKHAD